MRGSDHLHMLARGERPDGDSLLGNARCDWGGQELVGEEAILAAFSTRMFDGDENICSIDTPQGAALIGKRTALVADLYNGNIGRLWRIGDRNPRNREPAIDVAFDPDMRQERGDLNFEAGDHPCLDAAAIAPLVDAARAITAGFRQKGLLRVRGYFVRAFGDRDASFALLSLFTLGNDARRQAAFSYAAVCVRSDTEASTVCDPIIPRSWRPRF